MSAEGGREIRGQEQGSCFMEKPLTEVCERCGKERVERKGRLTYDYDIVWQFREKRGEEIP